MAMVYLGIGSNLGDKRENCERVISRLERTEGICLKGRSKFYSTKPVGGPPQEDYVNGAIEIRTELVPEDLLKTLKNIEKEMGRVPSKEINSPRIIDIDILLYDNEIIDTSDLVIPHPRMHERYFVLHGLAEIAPDVMHPVLDKTIGELYENYRNNQ